MLEPPPVIQPPRGKALRLWPLERSIGWYPVHPHGERSLPCLGWGCPYCVRRDRPDRLLWEGYLFCQRADGDESLLVLRLPRRVYQHLRDRPLVRADLRDWCAIARTADRRTARPLEWCLAFEAEHPMPMYAAGQSHRPAVLAWWPLPACDPEYRQAVYESVLPMPAPTVAPWRKHRLTEHLRIGP